MDSDDYWRHKWEEDRRRERLYGAVRRGDDDTAVYEASPDTYLDYLRLRGPQRTFLSPAYAEQVRRLEEERRSLIELVDCTDLDVHGRARLISIVCSVNLSLPDAEERLNRLRQQIATWTRSW